MSYGQIIADHTVVDRYDDIPQYYIDKVKEMWLVYAGESHSEGIRRGLESLETLNSVYQVKVTESGIPEAYTTAYLRASRATWGDIGSASGWIYGYGEEDWFTNSTAISRTKAGISYCNSNDRKISAIGFGWCWDETADGISSTADPVYGCRWYGVSYNGPEGSRSWGLDASDYSITGNSVCMDTYLKATQDYIDYCKTNGIDTKVFFTTGPVDTYYNGEAGYQGSVKHQYVRDYVKADPTRVLFDYADILCWDDNGTQTTSSWNGHTYPKITTMNLGDGSIGHIGSAGAIRLAKAMWWMLARIAGWDGVTTDVIEQTTPANDLFRIIIFPGELHILTGDEGLHGSLRLNSISGTLVKIMQVTEDMSVVYTDTLAPGAYIITLQSGHTSQSKIIVIS